ncbi:MAG: cell division protein SepF [Heliobacteriaceae bacterium]|jgi:cell division inhibitor SepF|nr:cell division protein SepF [Heliobacteriaceae bacterium]
MVEDGIKHVVDFLVKGWNPKETIFDEIAQEFEEEYEVQDNLAIDPAYSYRNAGESNLKVVNHPNYKGYEVIVMEPRSFEDAAQIAIHLKDRKTIVLNLHLLDKEQSQRTIDFVCGAAHALNGNPQKVGELVFVFTPSNVTLSVDAAPNQNKFNDSLWTRPLQQ